MLKKITASALRDRLQALRPSQQTMLSNVGWGLVGLTALASVYVIFPLLRDGLPLSPQQRVEPLNRRINDLDKQIKASKSPSTTDLKEIATLEKGRIDSENTIRTSLFQAVGGLLVFVTLYISWLTLKANEAKQVAERFGKAVEQLGSENIHVRLGGIYALEQIAKDAEEKYYWQVMETLTSYVRERSPDPAKAVKPHSSFVQAALEPTQTSKSQNNEATPPLPTDIQAVMTVLARRKHSYGHPLERHPLDLHGSDLRQLQLPPKTQLNQANLARTNLQEANLEEVNLQEASLEDTNLQGANLRGGNLQKANLWEANLRVTNLFEAKLQGAILVGAKLQGACLSSAELQGAFLVGANFQGVRLVGAKLQRANLWAANLQEAELLGAKLQGAILVGANLQEASLESANLQEAKFKESSPSVIAQFGAQEAIGLTWEQLDAATSYRGAILPDYLLPRSQQFQAEEARSPQHKEMLPVALNAIRTLMVSYKNE